MKDYVIERKVVAGWIIKQFTEDWKKRVNSIMLRKDGAVKIKIFFADKTTVIYKFYNKFFESKIKHLTEGK